ncbi:MAG: TetR/AcrR family transcriptional regulator [Paenibacillaceae bacterium]
MIRRADGDTKAKIIDAAYKVLADIGHDKASMKEIAKEAGVAQGLINYYFPSKEDLLFELFQMETSRYCDEMMKIDGIPLSETFIRDALKIPMELVQSHPEWHRLRFELFAIGLRSERGCQEIAKCLQAGREQAVHSMSKLSLGDHINKDAVSSILLAVLDGFALQAMSNPDFDREAAYGTFAEILEIYVAVKSK